MSEESQTPLPITPDADAAAETPKAPPPWLKRRKKTIPVDELGQPLEQPFAGYLVTEVLTKRGEFKVYRAQDERLGRDVAIKALVPDLDAREDAVDLFFNEARNVARLRHPNLVRGFDVGRSGEQFFFVMEYVRGESLADKLDRLERGKIAEADALPILYQAAVALQYVFENGLVHRDLRPGNILLGSEGVVKLGDLGVTVEVAYPSTMVWVEDRPSYMSPEQVEERLDIDIRADLYALGCIWYHMLMGEPPFRGVTARDVLRKHLEEEPASPRDVDVRITGATNHLLLRLLSKERDERPRTPQEFIARLAEHPLFPKELLTQPKVDPLMPKTEDTTKNDDIIGSDEE